MLKNPACHEFLPQLSPFVDGELTPDERTVVERHLANCPDCAGRVADFRAEAGLVRVGLEMLAEEADFTGFAQKVMARVTPQRPPFWERVKVAWSETWTYQRGPLVSGLAVAAVVLLAIPVGWRWMQTTQQPLAHLAVRSVTVDPRAHVAPVVMADAQTGDAIIWLVDHDDHPSDDSSQDELPTDEDHQRPGSGPGLLPRERPSGGDL